ncbi:MAG: DUF4349 domain-containing protein [Sandaracinaceae bacterium]|nr:DUF4349 domain-containing protein [Sandaracinaceae bacterium]
MRSRVIVSILAGAVLGLFACADGSTVPPGRDPGEPRDPRRAPARRARGRRGGGRRPAPAPARHRARGLRAGGHRERAGRRGRARPAARLEALRAALRALGEVRHEEEVVEDVTEQRSDGAARLRNARREEERLLALMSERTATLSDVIAVEARLAEVRERVEQLEAAERALAQRVELAEVHVELSPRSAPFWRDPLATLSRAGAFGVEAAAAIVVGAGALATGAAPTLALFALVLVLLAAAVRRLRRLGA